MRGGQTRMSAKGSLCEGRGGNTRFAPFHAKLSLERIGLNADFSRSAETASFLVVGMETFPVYMFKTWSH